ncbi:MAG TPA: hypothetical protein VGO16_10250, partial [Pseudonocardiaceae bacterium]|nr:hypothetical protein [Pseudonocardiaceae bacterium]
MVVEEYPLRDVCERGVCERGVCAGDGGGQSVATVVVGSCVEVSAGGVDSFAQAYQAATDGEGLPAVGLCG